jgi:hypothetical protein
MRRFAVVFLIAIGALALNPKSSQAQSLEGAWSGGGQVSFGSGARERARCRARYSRRSNEGYVVSAVCATPAWWMRTIDVSIIWTAASCATVRACMFLSQMPAVRQRTKRL